MRSGDELLAGTGADKFISGRFQQFQIAAVDLYNISVDIIAQYFWRR